MDYYESFLHEFFRERVKGVGEKKEIAIKESLTYEQFFRADKNAFIALRDNAGRKILNDDIAQSIINERQLLFEENLALGNYIFLRIRRFCETVMETTDGLTYQKLVEDMAINPLLVRALKISDFEFLSNFYVYQRVGRSIVTSFGTTLEDIIRTIAKGEKIPNSRWWDFIAQINNRQYYCSVKSGPHDMNSDQVNHFAVEAQKLRNINPHAIPIIAMAYGTKPLYPIPSTLVSNGLSVQENTRTGKELYTFLTGDENYYLTLLGLIRESAEQALADYDLSTVMKEKVESIKNHLEANFEDIDEICRYSFDGNNEAEAE